MHAPVFHTLNHWLGSVVTPNINLIGPVVEHARPEDSCPGFWFHRQSKAWELRFAALLNIIEVQIKRLRVERWAQQRDVT